MNISDGEKLIKKEKNIFISRLNLANLTTGNKNKSVINSKSLFEMKTGHGRSASNLTRATFKSSIKHDSLLTSLRKSEKANQESYIEKSTIVNVPNLKQSLANAPSLKKIFNFEPTECKNTGSFQRSSLVQRMNSINNYVGSVRTPKNNIIQTLRRKGHFYGLNSDMLSFKNIPKTSRQIPNNYSPKANENLGMDQLSQKMLKHLSIKLQSYRKESVPHLKKNKEDFNNYLIRDFKIGEQTHGILSSKHKLKLTEKFLKQKEEKHKIKTTKKLINVNQVSNTERQEKNLILNSNSPSEIDEFSSVINNSKLNTENSYRAKLLDEYQSLKIDEEKLMKKTIKENSYKLADMILDIKDEYEKVDDEGDFQFKKLFYIKNIERTIRLRSILKNKVDPYKDDFGMHDLAKFKEEKIKMENSTAKSLNKVGLPSFLKSKFKKTTIEKYKIVNGAYFGASS